jgi:Gas vesicle protein
MTELDTTRRAGATLGGLIDALDAVLADGAVVAGDLVIALDGIDLVRLDLRLLLAGIQGVPAEDGAR